MVARANISATHKRQYSVQSIGSNLQDQRGELVVQSIMALSMSSTAERTLKSFSVQSHYFPYFSFHFKQPFPSFPIPNSSFRRLRIPLCHAAKPQTGPVKKRSESPANKKKKKSKSKGGGDNSDGLNMRDVEIVDELGIDEDGPSASSSSLGYHPMPLPKPPAGFVVDDQGKVVMASTKRLAIIVDPANNFPLECVIRRVFRSSEGEECMLLCPVDTPVQILKSTNIDGWSAVSDEEVEAILPAAAYALAKIHMHLVYSGFCYTARGGFCYSEEDIFDFRTDDGQDVDGLPTEGIEITYFSLDGAHYMIYTPSDPLLFVSVKDQNGVLQIADDDLLEDPAIVSAIDEETEFNALVEEEAALLDSLMGKR
ncbi:BTB/POZ domain-containing protein TNFAIP1 isoform 2 [Quillaja saponaria]|uniref:BTB/POZ domain-containing protein TNFAIP1 isoform 2 n=1 Tax=Quillaja saponaria TaxID=32244 RepID=A0AAD7KSR1_QUISA|nr:BTB/POZ domain-containing protein TNFAIP1 isoform 2 [Quillaja saponaria]